jgi:hypothetical protein
MAYRNIAAGLIIIATLGACGHNLGERALTGAAIGAAAGAVIGAVSDPNKIRLD